MTGWEELPLKAMYRRRDITGRSDLQLLSVYRDYGVVPREGREDNNNRPGEDLDAYRQVHVDDLVLNKMKTWQGSLGVSQHDGIVSPAYFVCEQVREGIPRFLHHLLRSRPLIEEYAKRSKGIRPSQWDLPWDEFRNIRVHVPPLADQHAIAYYLDAESIRIDTLIAKKRRMADLLHCRRDAVIEQAIRGLVDIYGATPLKYASRRIEVGIVITPSAWYAASGVLALRGLNVRPGEIDLDDVVQITDEGNRLHKKSTLHSGDIVVVRTGQAGAACVVPPYLEGCNCIDLVIVRPSMDAIPKFLEFVINSDWTQKHVSEFSVGTIQSHFNVGAMKGVPIPLPPTAEQLRVAEVLTACTTETAEITGRLARQIDLLVEHRKVLISAAVSGELEIPRVSAA